MSITIQIGTCTEDPRKLDKSANFAASEPVDVTAQIKDNCSIMHPTFILSATAINFATTNYLHVADWHRYYYIDNIVALTGARVEVRCSEDVLTSNADAIKGLRIRLHRAQNRENKKVLDPMRPSQVNRQCETIEFKNCQLGATYSTDHVYVLTVQGGAH